MKCPELNDLNLNSCTNLHPGIMFFPSSGYQIKMIELLLSLSKVSITFHRAVATSVPKFEECACIWMSRYVDWRNKKPGITLLTHLSLPSKFLFQLKLPSVTGSLSVH